MSGQCDQKRPSCSQCIRAGQECHGYRDALSMMFKDETAVVANKAEKRYEALVQQNALSSSQPREQQVSRARSSRASLGSWTDAHNGSWTDSQTYCLGPPASLVSRYPTAESMTREITPSIEDQALGFFISNHASQPALVPRGQYEWLLEALSQTGCNKMLQSSTNAACLVSLANSSKNAVMMAKAQIAYGAALRMVNDALRVEETAVKDSTLMSVIMLGLYENFSFQDKRSIQAWSKHVRGASALVKLRGKEQFESNTARRVFHQFYGIMLLCSLESGEAVPDGMRDLYDYCNPASSYVVRPSVKPSGSVAGPCSEMAGQEDARYQMHAPGTFLDPARPTGLYHLVWPLYAAGSSDLCSSKMRQYAIDMLYFIALRIGTRQAVVLAEGLRETQRTSLPQSASPEARLNMVFGT